MSRTIDERVVEMRFDNQNFERNVQTSMSTIDKLKSSLNFDKQTSSLENLDKTSRGITFATISDGVNTLTLKFQAFGLIGKGILEDLGRQIFNTGKQIVKSLSFDQIKAGWDKYAEKTSAVQTIMAATRSQFSDTGEQMEYVEEQLDKLNWFTDETSFNFVDMVSNIGKFTSKGVKLDTAVTAMQGIATWAALSGANTQQASQAMYNLSQALGMGAVKLMDWRSIENVNMNTVEFEQLAIDIALAEGTLKKSSKGIVKTLKGHEVSIENFNQALSDGWFSKEVLLKTLDQYGSFTNKLYEFSVANDLTATEILRYVDNYKTGAKSIAEMADDAEMSVADFSEMVQTLSSDVYELGLRAFQAGQEAKTFQEAIEATRDAASTAWMNIFEILFGNYEEAKELFTDFSNELYDLFVEPIANLEDILEEWKEFGGRTLFLDGLVNIFEALKTVIQAVKDAFHDIFPPLTAEKLFVLTQRFNDFTKKLILNEEAIEKVKNILKIFFSALGIVKEAVSAVWWGIQRLWNSFKGVGGAVVDTASNFGEWLSNLLATIRENRTFRKVIDKVVDVILELNRYIGIAVQKIKDLWTAFNDFIKKVTGYSIGEHLENLWDKIKTIFGKIRDFFANLSDSPLADIFYKIKDAVGKAIEAIKDFFKGIKKVNGEEVVTLTQKLSPAQTLFQGIKNFFVGVWKVVQKVAPILGTILSVIGNLFKTIAERLGTLFKNGDVSKIFTIINGSLLAGLLIKLKKFVSGLKEPFEGIKDLFGQFGDLMDSFQKKIGAQSLKDIAIAIGILTLSIIALSMIDQEKLSGALITVTTEFVTLLTALKSVTKTMSNQEAKKLKGVSGIMIAMSTAVLIMALAIKALAKLNMDQVSQGVMALALICTMLVIVANQLNKNSDKLIKGAGSLILFAVGVRILVSSVKALGKLDNGSLENGLLGLAAILGGLSIFFNITKFSDNMLKSAAGILLFAVGLRIMVSAVKALGKIDNAVLMKGLMSLLILLAELSIFLNVTNLDQIGVKAGAGLILLAVGLRIMAGAVKSLGEVPFNNLVKGLIAVGVLLLELGAFINLIEPKKLLSTSIAMVIMGAAIVIMAGAIKTLGSLSFEQMITGLIGLGGALLIIAATFKLLDKSTLLKAAGLVVAAVAIQKIAEVFQSLGGMSWESIAKGLVALAGSLVLIVAAMLIAKTALPGAAAILVMAVALKALAPVLKTLGSMTWGEIARGLVALAGAFVVIGLAGLVLGPLAPVILALGAAIALLGVGLAAAGAGLLLFATATEMFVLIGTSGIDLLIYAIYNIIMTIITVIPEIVLAIGEGIMSILAMLAENAPVFAEYVVTIVAAVIVALNTVIPQVVELILNLLTQILESIAEHIPEIVQAGIDIILGFLEGITSKIGEVIDSVANMIITLLEGIALKIPDFINAGVDIIVGFINGLADGLEDNAIKVRDALINLAKSMLNAFLSFFGMKGEHDESSTFNGMGKNLIQGFINGIKNAGARIWQAVKGVFQGAVNSVKRFLGINSPSKVFRDIGQYVDEGFVDGVENYAGRVIDSTEEVGEESVNAMKDALSRMSDIVDNEMDADPTIRPVLDLTNVTNGIHNMDSMLSANRSIGLASRNYYDMNSANREVQNGLGNNDDVVSEISGLRSDVNVLAKLMSNLRVVMDTGSVVGAIVGPMDEALGRRMILEERGV